MLLRKLFLLVVAMVFTFSVAGCGDESATNGTLTLTVAPTDLGGGLTNIKVVATVAPAAPNMDITITGKHFKKDGTIIYSLPYKVAANPKTGESEQSFNASGDPSEITYFEATASIEGLFKSETVSIPQFVP